MAAWHLEVGPVRCAARLALANNAGTGALLVEPARELRLLSADGMAVAPRRATLAFQTLAAGEGLEATVEFPPVQGRPTLRLRHQTLALPEIR